MLSLFLWGLFLNQVLEVPSLNLSEISPADFEQLLSELHSKAAEAVNQAVTAQDTAAAAIKSKS